MIDLFVGSWGQEIWF